VFRGFSCYLAAMSFFSSAARTLASSGRSEFDPSQFLTRVP
jgi:hypothetical protein